MEAKFFISDNSSTVLAFCKFFLTPPRQSQAYLANLLKYWIGKLPGDGFGLFPVDVRADGEHVPCPEALHGAPYKTPIGRPDEVKAARKPVLRYHWEE